MSLLRSFGSRVSLATLLLLGGIALAPILGVAVAAFLRGESRYLIVIGGLLSLFVTVIAPIEVLLLAGVLGVLLADTRLVGADLVYYTRFIPMGLLAIRTTLDIALHRLPVVRVERSFLIPGLAFVMLAAFSFIYSITPELTLQRTLSMAFVVIAFGLGLPNYMETEERLYRAIKLVTVLIGSLVLVGGVTAGGSGEAVLLEQSFVRVRGVFGNPNTQGLLTLIVFFPLVWWWRVEQHSARRAALGTLIIILAGLVVLSGSRASFLGLVGGGIWLMILYGRTSARHIFLIVLLLIGGVVIEARAPTLARVFELQNVESAPTSPYGLPVVDRPYLIRRGIELGMRSPIWGVGFTASDRLFVEDRSYLVSQGVYISGAHNSYVRMFVDLGIIGLFVGFSIFVVILGRVLFAEKATRRDPTVALMSATVIAGLVSAFFEGWLFGFGSSATLPYWFFLALIPIRLTQLREAQQVNATASSVQVNQAEVSA